MSRSLSSNFIASANSRTVSEIYIVLITFEHADLAAPLRFASDNKDELPTAGVRGILSNSNEYIFCPFRAVFPAETDQGISAAKLEVDNVDRSAVQAIRSVSSAITVTMQVVLASDPDTVETTVTNLKLKNTKYNALIVSGDIAIKYFEDEPCPALRFTPSQFPGIF